MEKKDKDITEEEKGPLDYGIYNRGEEGMVWNRVFFYLFEIVSNITVISFYTGG